MISLRDKTLRAAAFLALLTLALYWPCRHFDFVQYDDPEYVFANPDVRAGLTGSGLVWAFVDAHASHWHPLTWLSHMLDCQLFGLNAGAHHMVNVLFHAANTALLFALLRRLTGAFWRPFFVAALFGVHPMHVESVAWISERKDVLSAFFFLLTLLAWERWARAPERRGYWRLALVFFALGLLSKSMIVTLPVVLLLLDFWPLRRFEPAVEGGSRPWRARLAEKWPFFLPALVFGVAAILAQGGAVASLDALTPWGRVEIALAGGLDYLTKLCWPTGLNFLYLRPASFETGRLVLGGAVLSGLSLAAVLSWRRRPWLTMGWLWFGVMLAPVSGLAQAGLQYMADHFTYLPAIGLFIVAAWSGEELARRLRIGRTAALVAMAAVACASAVAARHQIGYWRNTETLMCRSLELNPRNEVAHSNLAIYFAAHGRAQEAREHFRKAAELESSLPPLGR